MKVGPVRRYRLAGLMHLKTALNFKAKTISRSAAIEPIIVGEACAHRHTRAFLMSTASNQASGVKTSLALVRPYQ